MASTDYRTLVGSLLDEYRNLTAAGEVPSRVEILERVSTLLAGLDARSFLTWVEEDPLYSSYYYDVHESGACSKPREVAALVLEAIAVDAIESLNLPR